MTVVIDGGCSDHGYHYGSLKRLADRFPGAEVIGFDPLDNGIALWTFDGSIGFNRNGTSSRIADEPGAERVQCVDIARIIDELSDPEIILKLDVEGAEHVILPHLLERGMAGNISLLLVEWHDYRPDRRAEIEEAWPGPIEAWTF